MKTKAKCPDCGKTVDKLSYMPDGAAISQHQMLDCPKSKWLAKLKRKED